MRCLTFCLAILVLIPTLARASIVIHDGRDGIVAFEVGVALDSNGHTWNLHPTEGWTRMPGYDPPVPIDEILFWHYHYLVTMNLEAWTVDGGWHSIGKWPDLPAAVDGSSPVDDRASIFPNPSSGPCRVSFRVLTQGPISVLLLDVSGRVVRHLLDGSHPAGDYSVVWDGRDDGGQGLPVGMYLTRITTAEGTTTGKVVLTK